MHNCGKSHCDDVELSTPMRRHRGLSEKNVVFSKRIRKSRATASFNGTGNPGAGCVFWGKA